MYMEVQMLRDLWKSPKGEEARGLPTGAGAASRNSLRAYLLIMAGAAAPMACSSTTLNLTRWVTPHSSS